MDKCPDCPVVGRCVAEWTAHAAYCDWARAGGKRRDRVIELSAEDAGAPTADPPRPDLSEIMRLNKAAKDCHFRSTDSACGCGGIRCGIRQPGLSQVVSGQDCIECQRRYPDSPQGIQANHLD